MTKKKRVVIDTNLFISGLIARSSLPAQLLRAWKEELFTLIISPRLLEELEEVLRRSKFIDYFTNAEIDAILGLVKRQAERVEPQTKLPLEIRDPKDDRVLACALGGKADFLVTGDRDLLVLDRDPKLGSMRIINVDEFLP